jgi:hypothetical protein
MQYSDWLELYLEKVSNACEEGRLAVEYVRARKTRIGFKHVRKNVGGFWTLLRNIHFNSVHYSYESTLENPRAWTLLIHEVRHLQQGLVTALSVYGELDAWQYEFRVYKKLVNKPLVPALEEILTLPLNWDRTNLRCARELMQRYAGKGYRVDLLPLYPLEKEISYWLTRRQP